MYEQTRIEYEVLVWVSEQELYSHDSHTRKTDAMQAAREVAKDYWRVEVNAVSIDVNDENNILGGSLSAAWENGKKTTK